MSVTPYEDAGDDHTEGELADAVKHDPDLWDYADLSDDDGWDSDTARTVLDEERDASLVKAVDAARDAARDARDEYNRNLGSCGDDTTVDDSAVMVDD